MQVLESLDPDLVMKALEKQLDAARIRRVAAGTESVRWKLKFIAASSVKTNRDLRETASFGRSPGMCAIIFENPRNQIGHLQWILCDVTPPIFENKIQREHRHSPKGPAVKQLGNWIATLESAIQQTSGAKLELVKVGEWAKGRMGLVMERS